jgi:hypothetical protein
LCAGLSCWLLALKATRLEREFAIEILAEDRVALDAYVATLPRD